MKLICFIRYANGNTEKREVIGDPEADSIRLENIAAYSLMRARDVTFVEYKTPYGSYRFTRI